MSQQFEDQAAQWNTGTEQAGAFRVAPEGPPRDRRLSRLLVFMLVLQVITLLAVGVLIIVLLGIAAQVQSALAQIDMLSGLVDQFQGALGSLGNLQAPDLPTMPELPSVPDLQQWPGLEDLDGGSLPEVPQDLRDQVCSILGC